jgi:hypothetical protein
LHETPEFGLGELERARRGLRGDAELPGDLGALIAVIPQSQRARVDLGEQFERSVTIHALAP